MTDEHNNFTLVKAAVEATSRVSVLEERFDRHLVETRDEIKELSRKLSDFQSNIIESLSETKIDHIKDNSATRIMIYTVNGIISTIVSFFTAWLMLFRHEK